MEDTSGVKTVCPYCGVGCGMVLQVANNRVTKVSGNKEHPANFGRLCTKGTTCSTTLESGGRLAYGSVRESRDGKFIQKPIDAVLTLAAERFRTIIEKHGPDSVALYVSGQMSLESQYLANKLTKGYIGTNNIDSNSRLCMSSAASGYKLSLGADGPPGSYKDIDHSHCFLVIGSNMAECHPILYLRMMDRVKSAGAKLIVVDPRKTPTADKADLFLPIKPGTDLAFLNGLLHLLAETRRIDRPFIQKHTAGWELLEPFLKDYTPAKVAEMTGLGEGDIRKAAEWIGAAPEFVTFWTMGLNQSTHGTWNTNAICNLHLATGKICRLGSGPFSLTGQPNAMGGREVGYLSHGLPGQRSVTKDEDRAFLEKLWNLPTGSIRAQPGYDAVTLFKKMEAGEVKAIWIICTNPVASMPRRQRVIEGLQKAELVIVQDAYYPTETTKYADILLPGAVWAEAEGVMVNSERNVTLMQKAIDPPGEALADWDIVARIARKMGYAEGFNFSSAADVFDEIRQTWNPTTGYDLRGMSHAKLRKHSMQWPCGPEDSDGHSIRYVDPQDGTDGNAVAIHFPTDDRKGHFFARPFMPPDELPDEAYPFILITGRLAHQWHTMTKTGKVPTLNKLNPGPFVEIHPDDAKALNITHGMKVHVASRRGGGSYPAVVTPHIRPGACFVPFHWNDVFGEKLAINAATSEAVDAVSLQPEFKFCAVRLERVAEEATAQSKPAIHDASPAQEVHVNPQLNACSTGKTLSHGLETLSLAPREFEGSQKRYLEGMFCAVFAELRRDGKLTDTPVLPLSAPFDTEERVWVNGYLAGLFSRDGASVPQANAAKKESAAPSRAAITLVYASQTGNAEALAQKFAKSFAECGVDVPVLCLSDYAKLKWADAQSVLIVTSTYGDGDPPDNGKEFWAYIRSESMPRLPSLSYAVLALGDKSYDQFCKFGKDLDARLEELGARRLCPRVDCDTDYESSASAWLKQAQDALASKPVRSSTGDAFARISKGNGAGALITVEAPAYSKAKPFLSSLVTNRALTGPKSEKEVRHVAFSLLDSGLTYQAGDALGVWPTNCPELVDELLALLGLKGTEQVPSGKDGCAELRSVLLAQLEISKPASEFLAAVAKKGGSELQRLLEPCNSAALKEYLWGRQIADLLREHPKAKFTPEEFVALLKKLQPRLYSISSSPTANPGEVHITIGVVRYSVNGTPRKGVCSTFLSERTSGSAKVPLFIQASSSFKLPADCDAPVIMVGPGTGIAPFRAFLQERRATGAKGRNWLFFGDQRQTENFLYRDELESMRADGLLTRLDTAFSRDQAEKIYVQHRMEEQGAQLWAWLMDGAHFYVCGDASRMAKDVDKALHAVVQKHGHLSSEDAAAYVEKLRSGKRYQRDVY